MSRAMHTARLLLDGIDISGTSPLRVGTLAAHEGLMLEVEGFPHPLGTTARIATPRGEHVFGEVVGFRGQRSLILPFSTDVPFGAGARVDASGEADLVVCGTGLLGRVIGAQGEPLDGRPQIVSRFAWPLTGRKTNPLNKARVTSPFATGVRAIDGLLTIGEGQRVAIIAGSGVGKSVLMGQMLAGVECDVVVCALVGERGREVSDFVDTKMCGPMAQRSVVVAVPADHPPLLRLRAAMRATAIAEFFRNEGKRVFLLIDSLTRVAHAQREIGLSLGEPPTMKGYPPSALGLIPRLVERAGKDRETGGSITAVYTVLADGGDVDDPIVDAARAIVDGHIVLSRTLAEQGIYPAIDLAKSLSRTMPDIVDAQHLQAAARLRLCWSTYEDNRDLLMLGAYSKGNDSALDDAIARRPAILDFIRQDSRQIISSTAARHSLLEGFGQ